MSLLIFFNGKYDTTFFFFFFNNGPEIFLLFNSVGYSLEQGYEAERHIKAFEQISSAPIPTAGHTPLKFYVYIVNFLNVQCFRSE